MSSIPGVSPFPPIAEYAFLSNCHTGALVAPDGSVDWLCVPSFDSPSVFGSLLDRGSGYFRFGPYGINVPTSRTYVPGTNVLMTTWHTPSGWLEVREALTMSPRSGPDETTHGVSERGVLRQHHDTDALDASTLLAAHFGFLPKDDKRLYASVLAADELSENGFVLRYKADETDDGLSGKEGTFLICSFWLVSALTIVGETQRARDLLERLLRIASPLGLYAEEFEVDTARHLGNFPQAFSHLALLEAASRIVLADRLAEMSL